MLAASAGATEPFGTDLHGHPVHQLASRGERAVVLIFAASDCPISNRYVPEVARLSRKYSAQGIHFWWVFPDPQDTADIVAKHDQEFSITESVLLDTRQTLVHMAHASITPEAAVFLVTPNGLREVYHGRIDDRYLSIGRERPQPQQHDLEDAIAAVLAGKPVTHPFGQPVGCAIIPLQP